MAIGPQVARLGPKHPQLTPAEEETLAAIERHVDAALAAHFADRDARDYTNVPLPRASGATATVLAHLADRYRSAGWQSVSFYGEPSDHGDSWVISVHYPSAS